jgi:hypothetical protein
MAVLNLYRASPQVNLFLAPFLPSVMGAVVLDLYLYLYDYTGVIVNLSYPRSRLRVYPFFHSSAPGILLVTGPFHLPHAQ